MAVFRPESSQPTVAVSYLEVGGSYLGEEIVDLSAQLASRREASRDRRASENSPSSSSSSRPKGARPTPPC